MPFIDGVFDKKTVIAKDTFELSIKVPEDFSFKAGQYIWLVLPKLLHKDPRGERRAFSITSSPLQKGVITIQLRATDSGYNKTLLSLALNSKVEIVGPSGSSYVPDKDSQKNIIMIAGGVAIAPFLSILRSVDENENQFQFKLIYLNSSPQTGVFYDELNQITSKKNIPFVNHIGSFRENILPSNIDFAKDTFFICEPVGMVDAAYEVLKAKGTPLAHMHFEQHYPTPPGNLTEERFREKPGEINIMLQAIQDSKSHVAITDANGQIVFANKTAQKYTGFTFDEMRGNTPRLWGGLMDAGFYRSFWQLKITTSGFSGEIINRRKNGETYTVRTHTSAIYGESKNIIGYIGTEEDITILKEIGKTLE